MLITVKCETVLMIFRRESNVLAFLSVSLSAFSNKNIAYYVYLTQEGRGH